MKLQRNTLLWALLCVIISCAHALPITKTSDSQVPAQNDISSKSSSEKELESLAQTDKGSEKDSAVPPLQPVTEEKDKEEEAKVVVKAVEDGVPSLEEEQETELVGDEHEDDVISEPELKRSAALPQESYYYSPQDEESYMPPDLMNDIDLSPATIAQYLLMTSDFDGFNNALADVIATGIVTDEDIKEYRDAVSAEYEALLKNVVDSDTSYLQELEAPLADSFPTPYDNFDREPVMPRVQMPLTKQTLMDLPDLDIDEQLRQLQWENSMREQARLSNLLSDYYSDEDTVSSLDHSEEAELETLYELLQKAMVGDSASYPEETPVEDSPNDAETGEDSTEQELEELRPAQPDETAVQPDVTESHKVQNVVEAKE